MRVRVSSRKFCLWVGLGILLSLRPAGSLPEASGNTARTPRFPEMFLANQGQWPAPWQFWGWGPGVNAFFADDRVLFGPLASSPGPEGPAAPGRGLSLRFEGAVPRVRPEGVGRIATRIGFLSGDAPDPAGWEASGFEKVRYPDLWPGVTASFTGTEGRMKYELHLAAGADLGRVRLAYAPVRSARLAGSGDLLLETEWGELRDSRPRFFQNVNGERREVPGSFVLLQSPRGEAHFGFQVDGPYDPARELLIDPGLVFSTYLGGRGAEHLPGDGGRNVALALDERGNAVLAGTTDSSVFDPGAEGLRASSDFFLGSFDPRGRLRAVTFIGGDGEESLGALAVRDGLVYLAGSTTSSNYPTTAQDSTGRSGGGRDAVVTVLDATSGRLAFSTRIGGGSDDHAAAVVVDRRGATFLTGTTRSPDFPTTTPAFSQNHRGGSDAFLARLGPAGDLQYATYVGGGGEDHGVALAWDGDERLWLLAETDSPDLRGLEDAGPPRGGFDLLLSSWDPVSGVPIHRSRQGGSGQDLAGDLEAGPSGELVIGAVTSSLDWEVAGDAAQPWHAGGVWDLWLARLDPGSGLASIATYWGGSGNEGGPLLRPALSLDARGNWHLSASTDSLDFPITPDARRSAPPARHLPDAAYSKFSPDGRLLYSTYWGGEGGDLGLQVAADARGAAWLAGVTASADLPVREASQPLFGGGGTDAFLAEFAEPAAAAVLIGAAEVRLEQDVVVRSGDLIVAGAGELRLQRDAVHAGAGFQLRADRIRLEPGVRVEANLLFNHLNNRGEVFGELLSPLPLPALPGFPDFPRPENAGPERPEVRVPSGEHLVLMAGEYGEVRLERGATLLLEGGEYHFGSWKLDKEARVFFGQPALVHVSGSMATAKECQISPLPDSRVSARDLRVLVWGDAEEWSVDVGRDSRVEANLYAPLAGLRLKSGIHARGAFLAERVLAGADVTLELDSALADREPPPNRLPVAVDDRAQVQEDGSVVIDLLANDVDPDGDPIQLIGTGEPAHGTLTRLEGPGVQYQPHPDFFGEDAFSYRISDRRGGTAGGTAVIIVAAVNDPPSVSAAADPASGEAPLETLLTATGEDIDGDSLRYSWDFGDGSAAAQGAEVGHVYRSAGRYVARVTVSDGTESAAAEVAVEVTEPPDPGPEAPPLDAGVATGVADAARFLYEGPEALQREVAADAIQMARAALLRGHVRDREGTALEGVRINVPGKPELGFTESRSDGLFDLVVNGGGEVVLEYRKEGFLPVQRAVSVPWQSYRRAPDVVLVPPDDRGTPIRLHAEAGMQVARGTVVRDADGERQATVLFPPGTGAELVMSDGSRRPIEDLTVRATEFTVGESGPEAMPAQLPPASFYTYAVALTVDEALAEGAVRVDFSQPLPFYLENFLDFPPGTTVPLGNYDPGQARWVAAPSGRVIGILEISEGRAVLDVDGSGRPASTAALAELSIDEDELLQLGQLYSPGGSLWRVSIPHFSFWDLNWGWGPPPGAVYPFLRDLVDELFKRIRGFCYALGSVIECENQTLGQALALPGTPYTLHYRSDRVPGRRTERTISIPLTGPILPDGLRSVEVEVQVAGQLVRESLAPEPEQSFLFEWDGRDAFGRLLQGQQRALIRVGYTYEGAYRITEQFAQAPYGSITGSRLRSDLTLWTETEVELGPLWDARAAGLGAWTLSHHHAYDPLGRILYLGTGERRSVDNLPRRIDQLAPEAFSEPRRLAVLPDSAVLVTDGVAGKVRRLDPDGTVTTVAGNGAVFGPLGDGGPAVEARLVSPDGIAAAPDGTFYVSEAGGHRIRRVDPNGIIQTLAGTGIPGWSGDGGPAVEAQLALPQGLALASDGSLYVADLNNRMVRRISPDGTIERFAGTGLFGNDGDGGPAREARMRGPVDVSADPDGTLYIADQQADQIRRVDPSGTISTVAGDGSAGPLEDGVPATGTRLFNPSGLALGRDGSLYVSEGDLAVDEHRIRRITPGGILTTFAGEGPAGSSGDGGAARAARLRSPLGLGWTPEGALVVAGDARLRGIRAMLPGLSGDGIAIPSIDGLQTFLFDPSGRHTSTLNALTGDVEFHFDYDAGGRLAAVIDGDGRVTRIEHDAEGAPTAIVVPGGQRITLEVDSGGYLTRLRPPGSGGHTMGYSDDGLLTRFEDASGRASAFQYDRLGRLLSDADPLGGQQVLVREEQEDGYQVALISPEGRRTEHEVQVGPPGEQTLRSSGPDGSASEFVRRADESTVATDATGMRTETAWTPDARFGLLAPSSGRWSIRTPGGLAADVTATRSAGVAASGGSGVSELRETVTVNGAATEYDYQPGRIAVRSPEGRERVFRLDSRGRLAGIDQPGLEPLSFHYDGLGRPAGTSWGEGAQTRTTSVGYSGNGFAVTFLDASGASLELERDFEGRILSQRIGGGPAARFEYDPAGRLTAVQPPGRPAHRFTLSATGLPLEYRPPGVGEETAIAYSYDADGLLTRVVQPGGAELQLGRDAAGRLSSVGTSRGTFRFEWLAGGRLAAAEAPSGQRTEIEYDGALPVRFEQQGEAAASVSVAFDASFRLVAEAVNGDPVAFSYDQDGLLVRAGDLGLLRSPAHGGPISTSLGAVTEQLETDAFGQLAAQRVEFENTELWTVESTRDSLGRLIRKNEVVLGVSTSYGYSYDPQGRLLEVQRDGQSWLRLELDDNGNATRYHRPEGPTEAIYDAQDRQLVYGATVFEYAPAGHLRRESGPAGEVFYEYDEMGNLLRVDLPAGRRIEYRVDAFGRRVARSVDGAVVQRLLYADGSRPLAELDGEGAVLSRFVYGTRPEVPEYMIRQGRRYRIVSDEQGSPRLVVEADSGMVVQRLDYDPLGRIVLDTNPGFQPFGFGGGLADPDTGLVRLGARDYDPRTGRFTARDPLLFAGGETNLYRYALGDPVNRRDPEGLAVPVIIGGAAAGAAVNVAVTVGFAWLTGQDVTLQMVANAAISGAIAGAFGSLAGPAGGTLSRWVTGKVGTALREYIGVALSAGGSLVGQWVANHLTDDHSTNPCLSGLAGGLGGAAANQAANNPYVLRSLQQVLNQGPGLRNTLTALNRTGQQTYLGAAVSTAVSGVATNSVGFAF